MGDTDAAHIAPMNGSSEAELANGIDSSASSQDSQDVDPRAAALRRLSLTGPSTRLTFEDIGPRSKYGRLGLSGNVISATFCVPYKIGYTAADGGWRIRGRKGTSALFDSFSYLASKENVNHTLVGWTGEIDQLIVRNGREQVANATRTDQMGSSRFAQPIHSNLGGSYGSAPLLPDLRIPMQDRLKLGEELKSRQQGNVVPVWLYDDIDKDHVATFHHQQKWRRYAEHELFTLFHYKQNEPTDGREVRKTWTDYCRMNEAFADVIVGLYKPGDIILIHDYHLFLLPTMLRKRLPNAYIGFFLHITFPSSEYYRSLTKRKEILQGVLAANMIGFQTPSYKRHFASCATRILGLEAADSDVDVNGNHIPVEVFPIGINAEVTLQSAFGSQKVEDKLKGLRDLYDGKKIIVGRDRLDITRGVVQKLQAFEIFLQRHPEWLNRVILIQVTSPTSIEDKDGRNDKTANKISELVARINGTYGSLSYSPVLHYTQYLEPEEYFALLRIADVGLITSTRDGMNTTALEYVICQKLTQGPLIISEFSGTAHSLSEAIHINPWDLAGTAESINAALTMDQHEKSMRHQKLYQYVSTNTVQAWTEKYIRRLMTALTASDQSAVTPILDQAKLVKQYHNSSRRLFMFDYDGTLTPIVNDPQQAIPKDKVIRSLKKLAANPNNQVWIISGRTQSFLDEWMGHIPELGLSAEHGCFMRRPLSSDWENLAKTVNMDWQEKVMDIFTFYEQRTSGSHIERKKVALTWHYRNTDRELGEHQARNCREELERTVARTWDVEVMTGKANVEVRPRFVNKGEIAKRLINEYGEEAGRAPDFVLACGDDTTDEDMFRTLRQSKLPETHRYAVTVGAKTKQTVASWHLPEPDDVISVIAALNDARHGDDSNSNH